LALDKTGDTKEGLCTFGANIHDLLKTSFLHNSVIGDYAQWVINRIIICMQVYKCIKDGEWHHRISHEYSFLKPYLQYQPDNPRGKRISFALDLIKKDFSEKYLFSRIMAIDEPIIRSALLDEFRNVFGIFSAEQEISVLQRRLEELKQLMKEE
jgi:hypothetical protein